MGIGKALSFISPLAGAITGEGIGKVLPYLSPAYGIMTGKGPFNDLLSGLFGQAQQATAQAPGTPTDPTDQGLAPSRSPPPSTGLNPNDFLGGLLMHLLSRR
jgi:hypothetical protein